MEDNSNQHFDYTSILTTISSKTLFSAWTFVIVFSAIIYWILSFTDGNGPAPIDSDPFIALLQSLYFSIIVGTTTGLGDIVPYGISRFVTALQAFSSFILLAAFVAKLAGRRQEKVLDDIHQLSFDSSFHSIRNGLFIARKDIDAIIKRVLEDGELQSKDWTNLKMALRQMQIFIKHIPDFYQKTSKTHMFDIDREMLLIDSLERTLTRLVEALDLLNEKRILYLTQESVVKELRSLIRQIENMSLHEEQKTIDPENHESFQEIMSRAENIRDHLKRKL